MDITLTKHAIERLEERTGMTKENFEQIYHEEKILPIGEEESSSRIHELFYSHFVDQCYISIRDQKNSEIITILPVDYHNNCAWMVDHNTQAMMKMMSSKNTPIETDSKPLEIIPGTKLYIYVISELLFSEFTEHVEASELLYSYNGNRYRRSIDKVFAFDLFNYSFDVALGDTDIRGYIEKTYHDCEIEDFPYILFYHSTKRRKGLVQSVPCMAYAIYDSKEYLHTDKPGIQSIKEMTDMI